MVTNSEDSDTAPRTVTGVVVDDSSPIILDDGDETVECRGVTTAVKLGKLATVTGLERDEQSPDEEPEQGLVDGVLLDCTVDDIEEPDPR